MDYLPNEVKRVIFDMEQIGKAAEGSPPQGHRGTVLGLLAIATGVKALVMAVWHIWMDIKRNGLPIESIR